MLSTIVQSAHMLFIYFYDECRYAGCLYAECRVALLGACHVNFSEILSEKHSELFFSLSSSFQCIKPF
jgi:hypothetical protein